MFKQVLDRLQEAKKSELEGEAAAESGFTLIELMVVLLIMGILLAIAIPTFLGVTNSAHDRGAQSNLTNAITEAIAVYQANAVFTGNTSLTQLMNSSAPEFTWTQGADPIGTCSTTSVNCISVYDGEGQTAGDQQGLILSTMSSTGACWSAVIYEATPVAGSVGSNLALGGGTLQAGTYYAKTQSATTGYKCNAQWINTNAATDSLTWGPSYSSPGTA